MAWLDLVILALAVSRITRLIVHDSITEPLRNRVWRRYPGTDTEFGDTEVTPNGTDTFGRKIGFLNQSRKHVLWVNGAWVAITPTFLGDLISCHWCAGVWVAIAGWALWSVYPDAVVFLVPLAIAEVVGLLNDWQ